MRKKQWISWILVGVLIMSMFPYVVIADEDMDFAHVQKTQMEEVQEGFCTETIDENSDVTNIQGTREESCFSIEKDSIEDFTVGEPTDNCKKFIVFDNDEDIIENNQIAANDSNFSDADIRYSGVFDGVPWKVLKDWKLLIGEEGETFVFENSNQDRSWPWKKYCYNIKSVEFLGLVCGKGNHSYMFSGCTSLKEADVSGFNTSSVTDMSGLFSECHELAELDVSGFDTSSVTDMSDMFSKCWKLTNLNVSGFNTSNVTNMRGMFLECHQLAELNVSGFDTSNVTSMDDMFWGCGQLTEVDVSRFNTKNVTSMSGMFGECWKLTELDISALDTKNVTSMSCMFYECKSLTEVDVSGFDTSNVTDMNGMFSYCISLYKLDLSGFDTKNVKDMSVMFCECKSLTELNLSGFDTSNVTDICEMFYECNSLTELDVIEFDTSNVTNMEYMFYKCTLLTKLDVSRFDTSKVTYMNGMFEYCMSLTELDLSGFDTRNVEEMSGMFNYCEALKTIYVSHNWSIDKVSKSQKMFLNCLSLVGDSVSYDPEQTDESMANYKTGYLTLKGEVEPEIVPATKIVLNVQSAEISTNSSIQLQATLVPNNTTDRIVSWTSSNPDIVEVDENGKVTAKKYGTAKIIVTSSNGKERVCPIQTRFWDVNNPAKPYYAPVYWAVDNGITKATVGFFPNKGVTRGEFTAFLYRLAGSPKVTKYSVKFSDVNSSTKFYKEINWAINKGIIKGFSNGTFRPNDGVTRGQAAIMLWRYAGRPSVSTTKSPFTDVKATQTDTYKAIVWGNKNSIIKGYSDKTFRADESSSRANVVTFLYRYNQKF